MKQPKLLLTLTLTLLILLPVLSMAQQSQTQEQFGLQIEVKPKAYEPSQPDLFSWQYVFVSRRWSPSYVTPVYVGSGTGISAMPQGETSGYWDYRYLVYRTMDEALKELRQECGPGFPCYTPLELGKKRNYSQEFVGIYMLVPVAEYTDVKLIESEKKTMRQVEDIQHSFEWKVYIKANSSEKLGRQMHDFGTQWAIKPVN